MKQKYYVELNRQAEEMFERLIKQMADAEGISETLKANNQMEWVRRMNSIRNRAIEIVNTELIFAYGHITRDGREYQLSAAFSCIRSNYVRIFQAQRKHRSPMGDRRTST